MLIEHRKENIKNQNKIRIWHRPNDIIILTLSIDTNNNGHKCLKERNKRV